MDTVLNRIYVASESFIYVISLEKSSYVFFFYSAGGVRGLLLNVGVFY